jgi:hypothetical protein
MPVKETLEQLDQKETKEILVDQREQLDQLVEVLGQRVQQDRLDHKLQQDLLELLDLWVSPERRVQKVIKEILENLVDKLEQRDQQQTLVR